MICQGSQSRQSSNTPPTRIASETATSKSVVEKRVHRRFIQSSASEFIELFVGPFGLKRVGGIAQVGRCGGDFLWGRFFGHPFRLKKWRLRVTFQNKWNDEKSTFSFW